MKIFKKILTTGILMLFLLVRLAPVATATGNVLWSLENPLPTPNDLYAVWGVDANSVYAVGQDGVILYYDGNQPVLLNSPASNSLYGIWGSSPNDIFAVGDNGTIVYYDGQNWSVMSSGTTISLKGIWGSASDNVYAVGNDGVILHFNGTDWTLMESGTSEWLNGIWGSSPNDIFAVGRNGTIVYYDGQSWSATGGASDLCLTAVWGTAGSDQVYVSGWQAFAVGIAGFTVFRYQNGDWNNPERLSGSGRLLAGWSGNESGFYAVGGLGLVIRSESNFEEYQDISPDTSNELNGVWGSGPNNLFVVGDGGIFLHYDGTTWTVLHQGTNAPLNVVCLNAVWGSGRDRVVTAGWPAGAIFQKNGDLYWNTAFNDPINGRIEDIWGSGSNDIFAVGGKYHGSFASSRIWHYDGDTWQVMDSPLGCCPIDAVWGDGSDFVLAAKNAHPAGVLLFDGNIWSKMDSPLSWVKDLWGSGRDNVFAVGGDGIWRFNGREWSQMTSSHYLRSVWGSASDNVYAVGNDGVILHFNGTDWTLMESGTSEWLHGIWGSDPCHVFAVGNSGTILHYDGNSWAPMATPDFATTTLFDIWGSSPNDVYAVGDGGAILHYGVADQSAVYRFWSDANRSHFFTISEDEKEYVIITYPEHMWHYEGIAWFAYKEGEQPGNASPVHRFWSDVNQAHFYTINEEEKEYVIATYPENEWYYEGIAFYAFADGNQPTDAKAVHRFWSDVNQAHFYTINEEEKEYVIATYPENEWYYEGIAFYAYPVR